MPQKMCYDTHASLNAIYKILCFAAFGAIWTRIDKVKKLQFRLD